MVTEEDLLDKLRQNGSEVAQKQTLLEKELSKRPNYPQSGDIFVFDYPETMGLQWVVLHPHEKESQWLLIVPADAVPMLGSMDIELSKKALCSPLALRCKQGLWIHAKDFDINLRVGFLDKWDWQRALDKEKQISTGKLRSTISQQQVDDDLEYEEWMEQVIQGREVLKKFLKVTESIEVKKEVKKKDIIKILSYWYDKLTTLLPPKQMVPATLTIGLVLGFGINPLYTAFYNMSSVPEIIRDDPSDIINVLDEEILEFDETKAILSKGQLENHQDKSSEKELESIEQEELQFDETKAPLLKCKPLSGNDEVPQELTEELAQLPPEEWLNKSLEKIMEGDISKAVEILRQFQEKYPNYPE
jgi:hypothetical protein